MRVELPSLFFVRIGKAEVFSCLRVFFLLFVDNFEDQRLFLEPPFWFLHTHTHTLHGSHTPPAVQSRALHTVDSGGRCVHFNRCYTEEHVRFLLCLHYFEGKKWCCLMLWVYFSFVKLPKECVFIWERDQSRAASVSFYYFMVFTVCSSLRAS